MLTAAAAFSGCSSLGFSGAADSGPPRLSPNPQPEIAEFRLGPRNGRAEVATRFRLATTQIITALAEFSDGTVGVDEMEVVVTIAACTEE